MLDNEKIFHLEKHVSTLLVRIKEQEELIAGLRAGRVQELLKDTGTVPADKKARVASFMAAGGLAPGEYVITPKDSNNPADFTVEMMNTHLVERLKKLATEKNQWHEISATPFYDYLKHLITERDYADGLVEKAKKYDHAVEAQSRDSDKTYARLSLDMYIAATQGGREGMKNTCDAVGKHFDEYQNDLLATERYKIGVVEYVERIAGEAKQYRDARIAQSKDKSFATRRTEPLHVYIRHLREENEQRGAMCKLFGELKAFLEDQGWNYFNLEDFKQQYTEAEEFKTSERKEATHMVIVERSLGQTIGRLRTEYEKIYNWMQGLAPATHENSPHENFTKPEEL